MKTFEQYINEGSRMDAFKKAAAKLTAKFTGNDTKGWHEMMRAKYGKDEWNAYWAGQMKKQGDKKWWQRFLDNALDESLNEKVSPSDFNQVEKFADRIFAELDIDVEFTKHFKDRVNDTRNSPPISASELKDFFQKAFNRHGDNIAAMNPGKQALLNDIQKELNLPFVYKWDGKNFEFDLIAKTIMRKRDFKSSDKKLRF